MGAEYNIVIDRGATWIKTITWKNSGVPIDITGYSAIFTIKPTPSADSADALLVLTQDSTESGSITIDGTNGEIEIVIDATCTDEMDFDVSYYDLRLTDEDDIVTKLLRGRVGLNE